MQDLISRREAIDALNKLDVSDGVGISSIACGVQESAIIAIQHLPSAQPEQKKGKWIKITQGAIPKIYMCPFCNRIIKDVGIDSLVQIRYPFCHCGADMRE